ncbi:MAG: hypothetical protein JW852_08185 [Spirochaetales bacterium]|nr:hypothetical protein [Spirochaetales bacterium]
MTYENESLSLTIEIDKKINPCRLLDKPGRLSYADGPYSYVMTVARGGEVFMSGSLLYEHHDEMAAEDTGVVLEGRLDFGRGGPEDIRVNHEFLIPREGGFFEERIGVTNSGTSTYKVIDIAFGFRKIIYHREKATWADGFEEFSLVPVPHRRHFGQRVDRRLKEYTLTDLLPHLWEDVRDVGGAPGRNLPDHGSEGWVWTDGAKGLLALKYQPDRIEFSIFKGEMLIPDFCVRYGGAGQWRGDPELCRELHPGQTIEFGRSRYQLIEGGWKEGYYAFRDFLRSQGKRFPESYNPPVHWNELYNLSWTLGDGSTRYTLPELYREAEIAADIGCQALYLDPGWDPVEGSTIWDTDHFGITLGEFVRTVKERYGLEVSLHLMSHTNSKTEYEGMYRKNEQGNIVPVWNGAKVCMQSEWKKEKTRRVLDLARQGVSFFMFDFQEYTPPCYDPTHGHEVPLLRQSHAEGIDEVIRNVKREFPQVYIEAHDRITTGMQDYHPLYYQYDPPFSFDENWGFEYMWDSYLDLISGKAVSLYEYNLAYEIPLYLHINIGQKSGLLGKGKSVGPDNVNMLAFWWYASTVRHLGIGGVSDPGSKLYKALKEAMKVYLSLQDFYKRGTFYGIDEMAHVHTLPEKNQALINLFNLTGKDLTRRIEVKLRDIGLGSFNKLTGAETVASTKDGFTLRCRIQPMSPALVKVNF